MAVSIHTEIKERRKATSPSADMIRSFRRYARGRQKGTLSPLQNNVLRSLVGNLFADNVCGRVLSELRNRLRLARYEVEGDTPEADRVLSFIRDVWVKNHLQSMSLAVHWAMLRDGNHAVSVGWRTDGESSRVVLHRELWWNGSSGMWVAYDDDNVPEYAVKDWYDNGLHRRVIYYPDRIERYALQGSGWQRFSLPGDTSWPVVWTRNGQVGGDPIGIPVIHFANLQVPQDPDNPDGKRAKDLPRDSFRYDQPDPRYGSSELDGGVLGLQDEVNDVQRDITVAARFTAYQMYYGTGITPSEGEASTYTVEPGAFLEETSPDANFGYLPAGDIAPLKETLKIKLEAISRATSVPMFAILGDWPSGEALIRAEMPLIDKVESIAEGVGPAWGSVAHMATVLANTFTEQDDLNEDLMITAVFAPAVRRDQVTLADLAKKLEGIVSHREQLRILGYSPLQVEAIMEEIDEEREADPVRQRQALALQRDRQAAEQESAVAERITSLNGNSDPGDDGIETSNPVTD